MILHKRDLGLLLETAIDAAEKAGRLIASCTAGTIDIRSKAGGSSPASRILTEADLKSQDLILLQLKKVTSRFNLGILTEESSDDGSRFEKDHFWSIDPLDGTLPFIKSLPGYSVSIALVSKAGEPQLGVIYDPLSETLYYAVKGKGAFRNGKPLVINQNSDVFTFICDSSFCNHSLYKKTIEKLESEARTSGFKDFIIIKTGGAAMNAMWLLDKAPALYFKYPKKEDGGGSLWDYAASTAIVGEAGGIVSDFFGDRLLLNNRKSCFMNARGIYYSSSASDFSEILRNEFLQLKE